MRQYGRLYFFKGPQHCSWPCVPLLIVQWGRFPLPEIASTLVTVYLKK